MHHPTETEKTLVRMEIYVQYGCVVLTCILILLIAVLLK